MLLARLLSATLSHNALSASVIGHQSAYQSENENGDRVRGGNMSEGLGISYIPLTHSHSEFSGKDRLLLSYL